MKTDLGYIPYYAHGEIGGALQRVVKRDHDVIHIRLKMAQEYENCHTGNKHMKMNNN